MRIIFLLTQDLSSPSGLGRYLPWARELDRSGFEVRVIALHPEYAHMRNNRAGFNGISVEYVAQMHVKKTGNAKTYYSNLMLIWIALRATTRLLTRALAVRPDVVIVGKPHPMNGIAAAFIKKLVPRVKIVVDCDDIEAASNRFQNHFQRRIVAWFEKSIPKIAHVVTTNTTYNRQRLEQIDIPPEKIIYLPNGVDPARFSPPAKEEIEQLREKYGLIEKRVVSFIGSLSLISHPVDLLIHAFRKVHAEIPESVLMLVGGGEDTERLQVLVGEMGIRECCIFVGRIPADKVALYYALSDVTVDPVYDNEVARGRCPLKMFESWICGVPFITGDVGDRSKFMNGPLRDLLAKPGDSQNLAKVILELLKNHTYRLKIADICRQRVVDYFWSNLRPILFHVLSV